MSLLYCARFGPGRSVGWVIGKIVVVLFFSMHSVYNSINHLDKFWHGIVSGTWGHSGIPNLTQVGKGWA